MDCAIHQDNLSGNSIILNALSENEDELNRIREYIRYNALKWDEDRDNPENWDNV